ncbi:DUF559 domain-containing protein [Leucobacter iarius]
MNLHSILREAGGVMRVGELDRLGVPRYRVKLALERGEVTRPQRGWVAARSADPELLFAARYGVILSCVTAGRRAGLWQVDEPVPHVSVRARGSRRPVVAATVHWGRPVRCREPFLLVDSLENTLACLSICQPHETAFAIWESALNRRRTTRRALERFPFTGRARSLLESVTALSDSGYESAVLGRLRALGLRVVAQARVLGHRVDFLIGSRLVLQIDGSTHTGRQRDSDNRHDALLQRNGYLVIRVSPREVNEEWHRVQNEILDLFSQLEPRHRA